MVTIQFLPYNEIGHLTSVGRIRKILTIAKDNKIVLLQGRLKKAEEAELIAATMEEINKDFKGIELAVLEPSEGAITFRDTIANVLLGERTGMTIVGPANIVKSIKKNPNKIELFTNEIKNGNGKKRKS